jgi:6-phosphogluconolactonase (cycloisomerase 2 family)
VYTNDDNEGPNAVDGYLVTGSSQTYLEPTPSGGSALTPAEIVPNIVMHPFKDILYASNSRMSSIAAMKISRSTCQLTLLGDFPVGERSKLGQGLAVSPNGKWMFVSNTTVKEIYVFGILADGSLTQRIQVVDLYGIPSGMTVSPDGASLILEEGPSQLILSYAINDSAGHITLVSTISTANYPYESIVDPSSKYVYVGDVDSEEQAYEEVEILKIGPRSTLTYIANDTFPEGYGASGELLSADGKYLYVTNEDSASVTTFSVDGSDGSLTYVASASDGIAGEDHPTGSAAGQGGLFVFTVSEGQQNMIRCGWWLERIRSALISSA